ncbi:hypothetical protein LUZ60_005447 [Juncus effusus]|nr:hypothetical protein LUZ60_005447 [Juncus effusus]
MATVRSIVIGSTCINLSRRSACSTRRPYTHTSFLDTWKDQSGRFGSVTNKGRRKNRGRLVVVNEIAGQYEEAFEDINQQLMHYFTYKAVRTVLHQLYEMNPPTYTWLYQFVAINEPNDGKIFLRALAKERQDLAERVMITRLHLYGKWIKKCDHAKMYNKISEENLELMRERLIETIVWPSDDSTTEIIG